MAKWSASFLAAIIMLLIFCGSVLAQRQPPPPGGKGKADDPRMQEAIEMMFQDMDTNGDGNISRSEWMAAQEAAMQKEFRRVDRDGDGVLTKNEIRSDL